MQKCENPGCGSVIGKGELYELKVPAPPCKICNSDPYMEYSFCSRACVAAWRAKTRATVHSPS